VWKKIRRGYFSKHLILKDRYKADSPRDAALSAKRADKKASEYYGNASEDENVFTLLADRDGNQDEIQFATTILDFDMTVLQNNENVDHFINCDKDEEK
jgi:hypothetical protein